MKEGSLEQFVQRIERKNFKSPKSVAMEITHRCNLRCKFCYMAGLRKPEPDMPIKKLFNIINQLEETGCLDLTLLGGEPLIRDDFVELYKYIKKKGLLVVILTNGTLITSEIANCFKGYPPTHLRISIYAGSNEGYEKISGSKGIFSKLEESLKILKKEGVKFVLQALITKLNYNEFSKIKRFAADLEVPFWSKTFITGGINRDLSPLSYAIGKEEREKLLERYKGYTCVEWENKVTKRLKEKLCSGTLYISNSGELLACSVVRDRFNYAIKKNNLKTLLEKRLTEDIRIDCPCA